MTVTREQALKADRFHYEPSCTPKRTERWRRNGRTKVWKSSARAMEFRLPVKFGLREYSYITEDNADMFHTEADCPHGHI